MTDATTQNRNLQSLQRKRETYNKVYTHNRPV